ncbi:hypothetical protein C8J56DRAFT_264828 [Mycena floridula]|nr:hypothetical protein C8J56DRAFT_264828 [Mycena floridula]
MSAFMPILRLIALTSVSLFSIVVFVLALYIALDPAGPSSYFVTGTFNSFAPLDIVTAMLTVITLFVMIVVDLVHVGAFTSRIVFEFPCLSILSMLWLLSAAFTGNAVHFAWSHSSITSALAAVAFVNWFILMLYTILLFSFSMIASSRGINVWNKTVTDNLFLGPQEPEFRISDPIFDEEDEKKNTFGGISSTPPQLPHPIYLSQQSSRQNRHASIVTPRIQSIQSTDFQEQPEYVFMHRGTSPNSPGTLQPRPRYTRFESIPL